MKELPYFKFYPGEWMKGDVTDCSLEAQGLFINICVLYWAKNGDLTLSRVQRKFNTCSTAVQELIDDSIIDVFDDEITIKFLDEQFSEFESLREHKVRAGRASAEARKSNTCSTPVQQVSTIKRREEKRREDKEKSCLMKNSGVTIEDIKEGIKNDEDIRHADVKHYFDVVMDWSSSGGHKKIDWVATVRNWIRRDKKDGKFVDGRPPWQKNRMIH